MGRTASKRVLLIGGDQAFRKAFREAVGAARRAGNRRAAAAGAGGSRRARQGGPAELSVEKAADLTAGLKRIQAVGGWPYLVAVIHPAIGGSGATASSRSNRPVAPAAGLAEAVSELCRADEELPLLVCLPEARRGELAQMPADRVLWLRLPLEADEVRRLAAAQIDRRLIRLQTAHELKSMQQSMDRFKELAAAADRARSEMLANVSHELRTPLNAILGFSRLLMKEPLGPGQQEKLDYVCQGAAALREQVERLLDFARLTAGQVELLQAPFRLDQVIQRVLEDARPKAEAKRLAVYCHLSDSLPRWLRGDRLRLGQLLGNLVDNAVKFTAQGAVHLQVVLDELSAEAATLRITVSDTGVGISPDRQAEIFQSFAQGDGSSTRRFGGLGLGLAICKELTDLMGGQIGFRSAPGQGSTFWVWLTLPKAKPVGRRIAGPRKPGAAQHRSDPEAWPGEAELPAQSLDHPQAAIPGDAQRPGNARVLVAQPDQLSRSTAEMLFGRSGCLVDQAATRTEALGALRQASYDLVMIDAEMLGPAGPGALEDFRKREAAGGRRATVVALLPGEQSAAESQWLRSGADRCATKPCSIEVLLELIDHCAKQAESPAQGQSQSGHSARVGAPADSVRPTRENLAALAHEFEQGNWAELDEDAGKIRRQYLQAGCRPLADAALRLQLAARSGDRQRAAAALGILQDTLEQHATADTRQNAPV